MDVSSAGVQVQFQVMIYPISMWEMHGSKKDVLKLVAVAPPSIIVLVGHWSSNSVERSISSQGKRNHNCRLTMVCHERLGYETDMYVYDDFNNSFNSGNEFINA